MFINVTSSIDVLFIKLYVSVIFLVLAYAQPSTTISLKLIRPFPSKHVCVLLVILRIKPIL
jgi:hypothetical protein